MFSAFALIALDSGREAVATAIALLHRAALVCFSIVVVCPSASAAGGASSFPYLPTDQPCGSAIAIAEQRLATPPRLLAAIGEVESGLRDPVSGTLHPWPWTVNADGRSFFYSTQDEAVARVRAMQREGVRSIDIGCMQISLLHHPDAFSSLEMGFDPLTNVLYAARFLRELFARTGDWSTAVGLYHSATAEVGGPYRRIVIAAWLGQRNVAIGVPASDVARAWGATLTAQSPGRWQGMDFPAARSASRSGSVPLKTTAVNGWWGTSRQFVNAALSKGAQ